MSDREQDCGFSQEDIDNAPEVEVEDVDADD